MSEFSSALGREGGEGGALTADGHTPGHNGRDTSQVWLNLSRILVVLDQAAIA